MEQLTLPSGLEKKAQEIPSEWGIQEDQLITLGQENLETIYEGIHNLTIPDEMLDRLNPAEIIAKYFGVGRIKREVRRPQDKYSDVTFNTLVAMLDNAAYSRIGWALGRWKSRLDKSEGVQKNRLKEISNESLRTFVDSFLTPYHSARSCEPGVEESAEYYAREIVKFFEQRWEGRQQAA